MCSIFLYPFPELNQTYNTIGIYGQVLQIGQVDSVTLSRNNLIDKWLW